LDSISEFGRADIPRLLGRILDSAKLIYKGGGLPTPIDGRIARMSESEMPATGDGILLLLENRIQVLRLAAEILQISATRHVSGSGFQRHRVIEKGRHRLSIGEI
jgi:hypothetical protein